MGMDAGGIMVVGERAFSLGFKLIGVKDTVIAEGSKAAGAVLSGFESGRYRLVIASESIKPFIPANQLYLMERSVETLVLFVQVEEGKEVESVEKLAKRVLGITIEGI